MCFLFFLRVPVNALFVVRPDAALWPHGRLIGRNLVEALTNFDGFPRGHAVARAEVRLL